MGIVSVVVTIPFGIRNLVFITASQLLFLVSSSSDIQKNEVENFIFSDVLGNIIWMCTVLCAG